MPETDCLVATESLNPRALKAQAIKEAAAAYGKKILVEENPLAALDRAKSLASLADLVLVTGSLFLVGDIKSASRQSALKD